MFLDHDSNNNHVPDRGTISSKKPLTSSSSLSNEPSNQLDRSSYGSNTPTLPAETSRPTIRTGAPYSHSAIIEPLNKDHRIEMGLESGKPNNNNANNNKNKRNNNNSYRTSNSIVIIFLLEVIALVLLTVLGYVLHFTDTISVIQRNVHCMDLVQSQIPPEYAESLWFHTVSTRNFQLIYIIGPIILILLIEIIRQLILLGLAHNSQQTSIVQNKLNLSFPIYLRRTIRFIGGFLMGILMNTILVDIVQYQTGMIRPNLLETCPKLADLCRSSVANQLNHSQLTDNCSPADLKRSQMSFPSLTGSLVAYSTLYLILYLWYAMPYRALRFVRIYATLALMATSILTLNTRYLLNQNSLISLCVGSIIGILFALFIVYAHLNAFANRLSTTNVLAANRIASSGRSLSTSNNNGNNSASITNEQLFDSSSSISQSNLFADDEKEWFWKSFRIPRVHTFRQSARNMWKRSENLFNNSRTSLSNNNNNGSNQTTMRKNGKSTATTVSSNNAYINPAFNARDDSILANHIHQDSRFSRQDSTPNSNVPNVQYSSTETRNNQMRTFQA
ncbi:Phospholipid phosphatase- protein type 5 [Blomia tropicalis]|nr:Phospholipid phosphatase- protein type 5 [Blomia tropicalis]